MLKEILVRLFELWIYFGMVGIIVDKVLDKVVSYY